jgi:alpha,alpha-trehalase
MEHKEGAAFAAAAREAAERLRKALAGIEGALVEPKRFAVAVHYRQVKSDAVPAVEAAVDAVLDEVSELRKTHGKKVFELRPRFDWDKGKAVDWLLQALELERQGVLAFYLGDDTTDEDAFVALRHKGVGILVGPDTSRTAAHYVLASPEEVGRFLTRLGQVLEGSAGG